MSVTEKFETRGEIGHALAGLRDQMSFQAKVFAMAAGLSVVALGFLYNQYSATSLKFTDVLAANARMETRLDAMVKAMASMEEKVEKARAESAEAKRTFEDALHPAAPGNASFPGWIGVHADGPKEAKAIIDQYKSSVWIYATGPRE